ncbi:unnamed protein product [Blepharisma stoltei]|uniref:Uncharacterized protein n=1 Tax=Blepharisma stoltei TaxID=1481888 RepID=A0AAU9IV43_9CILI|nr:unnamed protein product [Blepharisma stoltei]
MPIDDYKCNSVIFNGNILISGYRNRNLLLYSVDNDSFSTIPCEFEKNKSKILINAERLYLIECEEGSFYESEVGSYSNWRRIGKSVMDYDPEKVYCSYKVIKFDLLLINHFMTFLTQSSSFLANKTWSSQIYLFQCIYILHYMNNTLDKY